ncbi:MAG: ROK family protein [Dehalococcoidia bacterium]
MSGRNQLPVGGIDLGATKILSVVVSDRGDVLADDIRPTEGVDGLDAVVAHMTASLRQAMASAGVDRLAAVGVDAPGPVDDARGVVTEPPNLPGWHDVPLGPLFSKEFGVPCVLENDANASALAEHRWGAGRGSRHMLFLTVSSGVGGGIVIDGALYRGASGAAGEVGHMTINARGPRCHCGRRGCLEMYASGLAIARRARRLVGRHPDSLLARLARDEPLTAKLVQQAAEDGDDGAEELIAAAGYDLGIGLGSLINIFNPQVIVIGGSLTKAGESYLGPAREAAQRESFEQSWRDVQIVVGALGDRSAAMGAAAVALDTIRGRPTT